MGIFDFLEGLTPAGASGTICCLVGSLLFWKCRLVLFAFASKLG